MHTGVEGVTVRVTMPSSSSSLSRCESTWSEMELMPPRRSEKRRGPWRIACTTCGTQRLPRIIGEAKALEMILRGLTVTGPSAHEIGMVHEVVDDPLARALEIAAELASRGAEGLAQAKRLTRAAFDRPLADGLVDERRSFGTVMRTASARDGLHAGRPPADIEKI